MRLNIRFFDVCNFVGGQVNMISRIGAGADGSVWLETAFVGLNQEALANLDREVGARFVADPDGRLYVDAHALAANARSPEEERGWLGLIDTLRDRTHPTNFRA